MDVRFDDHPSFQRCAAWCVAGGAALGMTGSLPFAAAGSALGLLVFRHKGRRIAAACASAAIAVAWAFLGLPWAAALAGAMFGLLLGVDRGDAAAENGTAPPSAWAVAATAFAGALAVEMASAVLPGLSTALASVVPGWTAGAAAGGTLGLWAALGAVPLHIRVGGDAVEMRLGLLRYSLGPDLRG